VFSAQSAMVWQCLWGMRHGAWGMGHWADVWLDSKKYQKMKDSLKVA